MSARRSLAAVLAVFVLLAGFVRLADARSRSGDELRAADRCGEGCAGAANPDRCCSLERAPSEFPSEPSAKSTAVGPSGPSAVAILPAEILTDPRAANVRLGASEPPGDPLFLRIRTLRL